MELRRKLTFDLAGSVVLIVLLTVFTQAKSGQNSLAEVDISVYRTCKTENAGGPLCNQCKAGTFHLSSDNQFGCINCFCMGIVTQCASSSWYRTQERSSFFQSPQGFALVDAGQQHTPLRNLSVESSGRELAYRGFSGGSGLIYYWQLPEQYLGDKVTSYGGYLNYTVRYVASSGEPTSLDTGADVEINGNEIRLLHFRRGEPLSPSRLETVSVPLLEQYWQRTDGQVASREHLLMALANLDALLIRATYATDSSETYLSEISLDYSISRNTGQERAWAVEECQCPEGYIGLSCQECASGFTRSLKGRYLGICERSSGNGHTGVVIHAESGSHLGNGIGEPHSGDVIGKGESVGNERGAGSSSGRSVTSDPKRFNHRPFYNYLLPLVIGLTVALVLLITAFVSYSYFAAPWKSRKIIISSNELYPPPNSVF